MATNAKKSTAAAKKSTAAAPATTPAATETATTKTVVVAAKAPSRTSQARPIFDAALAERQKEIDDNVPLENRVYKSNKDFRMGVCRKIATDLGCSLPSAGSMYNSFKTDVEKSNANLGLGRDPKKEKPVRAPRAAKVVVAKGEAAPETGASETQETAAAE